MRTTGSGMGCPDWPKCFGSFVPPTSVDQLPTNYKETYAALREKKNVRFAKYLTAIGAHETADKILNDPSILVEADFNPTKTWIEYVNRLVGVAIGILIVLLAWRSIRIRHLDPIIFRLSIVTLAAVIFQGWFGSIVVSTNLTTWTITVHMLLALAIVLTLVFLLNRSGSRPRVEGATRSLVWLLVLAMVVLFAQLFLGTEVRAGIDRISASLPREEWIQALGGVFLTHRTFSWAVLAVNAFLIVKIRKTGSSNALTTPLIVLILGSFLTGVGMAYLAVPSMLQPLHLLLATMAIGTQALLLFRLLDSTREASQATS